MTLRTLGIAALAMFSAGIGLFTAALCKAAAVGDRHPIPDNSGYPGLPAKQGHNNGATPLETAQDRSARVLRMEGRSQAPGAGT